MKIFCKYSLVFLAALALGLAQNRPNFIFIYADDLGFGDVACHGNPSIKTPSLDRLAREGTDFWGFSVVNPVCSASRTGIMTGQFPARWGVNQHFGPHELNLKRDMPDWLDPLAPSLPRVLREAGYRTAHYGKWHLAGGGIPDAPLPTAYGFDDAAVWAGPGRSVFEGTAHLAEIDDETGGQKDEVLATQLSIAATDRAVKFIRETQGSSFYLNLWLHETHYLVAATEEEKMPYRDVAEPYRTYYAAVTRADRQVGRILAVLDELGLAENTIVVFSSDNGPENSQPEPTDKLFHSVGDTGGLRGRKRSLLMGGVNTPFIVRWPGMTPAGRQNRVTVLAGVDVFPTFLAAAGVEPPQGYAADGENLLPAIKGEPMTRTKPIFWWWPGKHTGDDWPALAMRDGEWSLIIDESGARMELYNVVADRAQAHNVAAAHPERVGRMKSAIDAWFATLPKSVDPSVRSKVAPRSGGAKEILESLKAFIRSHRLAIFIVGLVALMGGSVVAGKLFSKSRSPS